jgi:hypothetical protein
MNASNSKSNGSSVPRLSLDVWNTRQLESTFVHDWLVNGLETVVWVIFPISFRYIGPCMSRIRPVGCSNPTFERILLPDQIFLSRVTYWYIARVYRKPRLVRLRGEVVVRCARVP